MQRVKLFVFFSFILCTGLFFGLNRSTTVAVSGQGSLDAPTGVRASDGNYADRVGIMWDTMRGANLYRIFRNTTNNPAGATAVGTSAANYFFDASAQSGQTYFYWVKAENGANESSFSTADQGARG